MDCSKFDWKAYVLEEVSAAQAGEYALKEDAMA